MESSSTEKFWRRRDVFDSVQAKGWVPYSFLQPFLAIAFLAIGVIPFMLLGEKLGWVDENQDPVGAAGLIAFLSIVFSLFALAAVLWCLFVERRPIASMGLSLRGAGARAFRGWLIGVGMIVALLGIGVVLGAYEVTAFAPAFSAPGQLGAISLLAAAFFIQGGAEEIIHRGWLLSSFAIRRGLRAAIVVSTLLFSLGHFSPDMALLAHLNIVLFSVFAVLWAIHEKSVIGIAAWHGGWNWMLATGFDLRLTGLDPVTSALMLDLNPDGPDFMTGGDIGPEGSVLCTLMFTMGIVYFLSMLRKEIKS